MRLKVDFDSFTSAAACSMVKAAASRSLRSSEARRRRCTVGVLTVVQCGRFPDGYRVPRSWKFCPCGSCKITGTVGAWATRHVLVGRDGRKTSSIPPPPPPSPPQGGANPGPRGGGDGAAPPPPPPPPLGGG